MQQLPLPITACQRWRRGRSIYRPLGETIDPSHFHVEQIPQAMAKTAVYDWHYLQSFPAQRASFGYFHKPGVAAAQLVGVAVFAVPINQATVPKYTGLAPAHGVELSRFVLLDSVAANGESHFLARALRLLRDALPDVAAVVSFSDPMPRVILDRDNNRRIEKPGHVGSIYQSLAGSTYRGRTDPRWIYLSRYGSIISQRTLSKLRADDQGAAYAYRQLIANGAAPIRPGEDGATYLDRVLADRSVFRRILHPGNFAYVFPIGNRRARTLLRQQFGPGHPYPKLHMLGDAARAALPLEPFVAPLTKDIAPGASTLPTTAPR